MKPQIFTLLLAFSGIGFSLQAQVWQEQNPGFTSPTTVWEVIAPNENTAWAYGFEYDTTGIWTEENYTICRTADGGQTWANLTFPHTEPGYFSNISARNSELAWISYVDYANGNKIYKTTDGGQNWTEQPIAMSVWINFVHFFDNAVGVAMGDPDDLGFEIFTTENGGFSWDKVDAADVPPPLPGEFGFSSYYEVSGNKVWFETSEGRVYFSPNKGNTWEVFSGPQPEPYSMFAADDAGMCYMSYVVAPVSTDPTLMLYRTPDNGATWENITPADNGWWIYDIEPVPGTGAIISQWNRGFVSGIIETRISYDQGTSWLTIDTSAFVKGFDFSDAEHGFATGWQFLEDTTHADVYSYIGASLTGLFDRKPLNVNLLVSPSPTADFAKVELESPVVSEFLLLLNDANGRLIRREVIGKTAGFSTSLDLRSLPAGVYTLTVSTAEGVAFRKILKQ